MPFTMQVYNLWMAAYRAFRSEFVNIVMTYDGQSSGYGKRRIKGILPPPVDYSGTDSVLTESEHQQYPDLQMFPTMAG